jgi:hypothetical protein
LVLFLPVLAAAAEFRLPSYLAVQGGLGNEGYKDGAVNLGLTLPGNWLIEAGADKTVINATDDSDDIVSRGVRFGAGSDPLRLLSVRVLAESWEVPDDVKANGGRLGVTLAPGSWEFTTEFIGQQMKFTNLPLLVSSTREQTVQDTGLMFRISKTLFRDWNLFLAASGHHYDKDLSQLSDLPAVTLNNMPSSVMTTLTGLSKNDVSLGGTYYFRRFDAGLEGGRSISAIDGVRVRRLGANVVYYLNRAWSFGISTMIFKPEASQESSATSSATAAAVTYKW